MKKAILPAREKLYHIIAVLGASSGLQARTLALAGVRDSLEEPCFAKKLVDTKTRVVYLQSSAH